MRGTRLGPYVIEGELASGGMATVYVATHMRLGHVVAIKVLHPHLQKNEDLRSRFVDEARIQANFRHPNILTVQDILELPEASGMVMELLQGCSLNTYYRTAGTPLPLPRVMQLFTSLANALNHAHEDGVVHRDLKPSNVFLHVLGSTVTPKLMDFGVAKYQSASVNNRLTATGMVLGTPHYMAPEQFEDSAGVDRRADIFSIGVMLYEATTGLLPFEGKSITSIMKDILSHEPARPTELLPNYPQALERVVGRCLQKRREMRYRSAAALEEDLRQIADTLGYEEIPGMDVPRISLEDRGIELTAVGELTEDAPSLWGEDETQDARSSNKDVPTIAITQSPEEVDWEGTHVTRVKPPEGLASVPGYRITHKIYDGSETIVYRGVSLDDDSERVIIKVLTSQYPSPREMARLKHEYRLLSQLDGVDGVPTPVGLERYRNGLALLTRDIGAVPLRDHLEDGRLPLGDFLDMAIRLADILGQLHARHVVHKDINPKNIVVHRDSGQLQVIDFGLASVMLGQHEEANPTGGLEGTIAYLSPEQTGRMNRPVDYRTDFYSLGITLYEMLCGKHPFDTTDRNELVHCHLAVEPPAPREVDAAIPRMISDIIMKLLSKNAEDRYQSGRGLGADLEECHRQLGNLGTVAPFSLGSRDISDKFQIPQKLYGRDEQVEQLMEAFARVTQGYKEFLLVSGYSGIGKTSLVREVYKPITSQHGYFITGKFDQYKRDIPYGALIEAFQGMVRELLGEGEEQLQVWREELLAALGNNGHVIVDVIPEIELVIGEQPPVPELPAAESLNRLNLVFHTFISVFATENHPLVIFLDDLQWADSASLNLVHVLMTGSEHQHLFLIGAYRDNEVDAAHPLRATIEELTKAGTVINELTLPPLELPHIAQLVADTLNCTLQAAGPLAELLLTKTGGNPFFMGEFLKSLYARELILFNVHNGVWEWDLARIQAEGITDNVVDLMADKIKQMQTSSQQALKLAACVGNQFDLQTLALVSGKSPSDIINALTQAVTDGLIVLLGDAYKYLELDGGELAEGLLDAVLLQAVRYKFVHDKIQQAAYSLIPEEARQTVHRQIGLLLLNSTSEEGLHERIFAIVNQLNEGRELAKKKEERQELARLNLIAGRRAKVSAAYRTSFNYFRNGLSNLEPDAWKSQYQLCLELHHEASESAYLSTEFQEMEKTVRAVLENAQELAHKVPVYETQIQGDIARSRKVEAISTGLSLMRQLGVRLPEKPTMKHVVLQLVRTRFALLGKRVEELVNQAPASQENIVTAMRIATRISSTAYVVDANLFPVLVLKQVELSARFGNTTVSPFAYALYGTILCGVLGDIDTGYRFGKIALELQEKLEAREHIPRTEFTAAATSQHFVEPLPNTYKPLLDAYKHALENGDLEFAGTNSGVYVYHIFFAGQNLVDTRSELTYYAEVLEQIKQDAYLSYVRLYLQVTINLMGEDEESWVPHGRHFDHLRGEEHLANVSDSHGLLNLHLMRLFLATLKGDFQQAMKHAEPARTHLFGVAAMFPFLAFHFYEALAALGWHDQAPEEARAALRKRARKNLRKLKKWASHAPENHLHKYHLIKAEYERVKGRHVPAMEHYDKAIDLAHQHGFQQETAIANERAARFYLALGKTRIARSYLTDAYYGYHQWGASVKVRRLEREFPEDLVTAVAAIRQRTRSATATTTGSTTRNSTHSTSTLVGDRLDMSTVLKASQVLSAEIHLDLLLQRMMQIVVENAGAERGILILEEDGKLYVEAEARASDEEVNVLQHLPARDCDNLAQAVVNYVMRMRETVVLADALNEGNFSRDAYVLERKPKSILCLPLTHQGRLAGLLYLENNLATGAFTPDRVEILGLLTSEIVVSLQNARLYEDLQRNNRMLEIKVRERTHELRQTNRDLEQARKKSDELLLNILPERVAEELKRYGEARPERFENVTVFFSDFVDFTSKAAQLTPEELLDELNDMFSAFDGIVIGYGCERIKTIGDAYLCVAGLPLPRDDHAQVMLACTQDILAYMHSRNRSHKLQWQLRMGIHSGPVIAGVVGNQKYIYDVFGDTINTASRMESHSQPMRINLSETTAALLDGSVKLEERPPIDVKGKGEMKMFFVRG